MNNDYIYRSFTKAELVQRCIDFGINRVAMLAERSRLRAELAECRRDAERYRAIKKGVSLYIPNPDCYDFDYVLPSDLDAMADAALAAKGE